MKVSVARWLKVGIAIASVPLLLGGCGSDDDVVVIVNDGISLSSLELLGKKLFFDMNLSTPKGQSCSVCHAAETGFTGPTSDVNAAGAVYPGAIGERFGNRKPPSAAYATQSPIFHFDAVEGLFLGGNFWDGRATGELLGNPAADQALGPFLNPVEQNMASARAVCEVVAASSYADLFKDAFPGVANPLDCVNDVAGAFSRIGLAIAAYEASPEVNAFKSKYDSYLRGKAQLSPQELAGLQLFEGKGSCNLCHPSELRPGGELPLFTDYSFDNLGVPKNLANPFYSMDTVLVNGNPINPLGHAWIDNGLGAFLETRVDFRARAAENMGKQKVPTLRNVDKRASLTFVKAYAHNGYFKTLKSIVHFYNTRDVLPICTPTGITGVDCWPAPEVASNVNVDELGNLGLTDAEEDAIVAFLKTLSDGYRP
jgi:cytochrome c peroxidase